MMVETVANKQGDEKHSMKKSREKLNLLIENNSRGEKDTAIQSHCKRNLEISSKDDTIDVGRKRKIINDEISNTTHIEETSQEETLSQVKKKRHTVQKDSIKQPDSIMLPNANHKGDTEQLTKLSDMAQHCVTEDCNLEEIVEDEVSEEFDFNDDRSKNSIIDIEEDKASNDNSKMGSIEKETITTAPADINKENESPLHKKSILCGKLKYKGKPKIEFNANSQRCEFAHIRNNY